MSNQRSSNLQFAVRRLIWLWADTGLTRRIDDHTRLRRLKRLNFPDGPKQIVMLQIACTYWRLGAIADAVAYFREAAYSERRWGKRSRSEVSEYILKYSEFYLFILHCEPNKIEYLRLVREVHSIENIPSFITEYKLPLPKC